MAQSLRVIARRGMARVAPENTMAAFIRCIDLGVDWFHAEVRSASDGSLVVMGDETVDRTTNGSGTVARMGFADLRRLDAGAWFDARFRLERIPELSTVVDFLNATRLGAVLEVVGAGEGMGDPGPAIARVLSQVKEPERLVVTSYSAALLSELHREGVSVGLGLCVSAGRLRGDFPGVLADATEAGCTAILAEDQALTPERIAALVDAGFSIIARTVDDVDRARTLDEAGVWGIISTRADLVAGSLQGLA